MKLEKRRAEAARKGPMRKGASGSGGTVRPSDAMSAAEKSPWSKRKPATITTLPSRNMMNIIGTRVSW